MKQITDNALVEIKEISEIVKRKIKMWEEKNQGEEKLILIKKQIIVNQEKYTYYAKIRDMIKSALQEDDERKFKNIWLFTNYTTYA